jgi:hypothetical protein
MTFSGNRLAGRVKFLLLAVELVVVSVCSFLYSNAISQELAPNKFLPQIKERERYSEIICSATIVKISPAGNAVRLQGREVSQWIAVADVDHVFKGTLDPKTIEFKYYGFIPPPEVSPPTAYFHPGLRYILFLSTHDSNLEVAIPVYQMEIELAPTNKAGYPVGTPELALANELVTAIESAPKTTGRLASTYFSWAEELIGKQTVPLVEPFLNSSDPLVRYQAAWWLSFRKLDAAVVGELKKTSRDQNVEEWARSGARERLRDVAEGRYVP